MRAESLLEEVKRLYGKTDCLYIYGAGFYGKDVFRLLNRNGISIEGFIVTELDGAHEMFGKTIRNASDVFADNIGIILGLSESYVGEVLKYLEDNNVNMDALLDFIAQTNSTTERQNELLRQQNEYLRQLNDKEFTAEVTSSSVQRAMNRTNRRAGVTVMAVGPT